MVHRPGLGVTQQLSWRAQAASGAGRLRFRASFRLPTPVRGVSYALIIGFYTLLLSGLIATVWPRVLGHSAFIVRSGSMAGIVPVGSIAVTEEVRAEEIEVGDVIVFYPPATPTDSSPLLHRVRSIREENGQRLLRTKGDANATPDPWELALQGRGARVLYSVPYVGYLFGFARTPAGWTLLVLLPAGYLGLTVVRRIWAGKSAAR